MKLQTKILILLSLVTTIILLFFVSYQFIRFRESSIMYKDNLKNQELVISKVMEMNSEKYEQLINDNSGWDDMVYFADAPDTAWARENVDFFVNSFDLSFILVFNRDSDLVYQFGDKDILDKSAQLDKKVINALFAGNPFPRFFARGYDGIYEIFGATIVPAADSDTRNTAAQGFLFTGIKWDEKFIENLAVATNFKTRLLTNPDSLKSNSSQRSYIERELTDFKGTLLAKIVFTGNDPVAKEKNLLLMLSFLVLLAAVASVAVLMYYFGNTVIQPLKQISNTLGSKNPGLLKIDENNSVEFKQIKELINGYFQQEQVLKANFAELSALNISKNKLFSVVAVNLKSPVEGLITLSDLLNDSIKRNDHETTKELLDMIGNQANQTLQLLENLFNWSKLQSAKIDFAPEETSLKMVIEQVVHDLKLAGNLKNIKIEVEFSGQILVSADYKMLRTILQNLVSNAIKFTYTGGWVKIAANTNEKFANISVSDNGIGISAENLGKLFEVDATKPGIGTDNERGTGLGLIISKVFVEKHGGTISVVSSEGNGSEFSFSIPLAPVVLIN